MQRFFNSTLLISMPDSSPPHLFLCAVPLPYTDAWPTRRIAAALASGPTLLPGLFSTPAAADAFAQFRDVFDSGLHYDHLPVMDTREQPDVIWAPGELPPWMNERDAARLGQIHAAFQRHAFDGAPVQARARAAIEDASGPELRTRREQLRERHDRLTAHNRDVRLWIAAQIARRFIVNYHRFHEHDGQPVKTAASRAGGRSLFAPEVLAAIDELAQIQADLTRVWIAHEVLEAFWAAATDEMLGSASHGEAPRPSPVPNGRYERRIWAFDAAFVAQPDLKTPAAARAALALLAGEGKPESIQPESLVKYMRRKLRETGAAPPEDSLATPQFVACIRAEAERIRQGPQA